MAEPDAPPVSRLLGHRVEVVRRTLLTCLHLPGDVAECGVAGGETSAALLHVLAVRGIDKAVHLFDSFAGLPDDFTEEDRAGAVGAAQRVGNYAFDAGTVRGALPAGARFELHEGLFRDTLPRFDEPLCFLHADADLFESTRDVIAFAERVVVPGGAVVFDDYGNPEFPGVRRAVDRYLSADAFRTTLSSDGWQAVAVRTGGARAAPVSAP